MPVALHYEDVHQFQVGVKSVNTKCRSYQRR